MRFRVNNNATAMPATALGEVDAARGSTAMPRSRAAFRCPTLLHPWQRRATSSTPWLRQGFKDSLCRKSASLTNTQTGPRPIRRKRCNRTLRRKIQSADPDGACSCWQVQQVVRALCHIDQPRATASLCMEMACHQGRVREPSQSHPPCSSSAIATAGSFRPNDLLEVWFPVAAADQAPTQADFSSERPDSLAPGCSWFVLEAHPSTGVTTMATRTRQDDGLNPGPRPAGMARTENPVNDNSASSSSNNNFASLPTGRLFCCLSQLHADPQADSGPRSPAPARCSQGPLRAG